MNFQPDSPPVPGQSCRVVEKTPELDDFLQQLDDKLRRRNERLTERLLAWAELLDAAGWCVALIPPDADPWLGERATRDLQTRGAFPTNRVELLEVLQQLPAAVRHLDGEGAQVWSGEPAKGALPGPIVSLTVRETEVLGWLRGGKTSPEIAIILGCATRTVETHVANLYRKLGVRSRSRAILSNPQPRA